MQKLNYFFISFFLLILGCQKQKESEVDQLKVYSETSEVEQEIESSEADLAPRDDCPEGYLKIAANLDLGTAPFCVMKYEARQDQFGRPVSRPENLPWTNITQIQAKQRCQALGARFDLISNPEWVAIARDIESVDKNWSEGEVGRGHLPKGWSGHSAWNTQWVSNLDPTTAPSTEDCEYNLHGSVCASSGDHMYRRTLYLSSGRKIWDFVGNTWNWVDWTIGGDLESGPRDCPEEWKSIEQFECSSLSIQDIGPSASEIKVSLGYGQVYGGSGGAALRGGPRPWFASGPFALILAAMPDGAGDFFGFRCARR